MSTQSDNLQTVTPDALSRTGVNRIHYAWVLYVYHLLTAVSDKAVHLEGRIGMSIGGLMLLSACAALLSHWFPAAGGADVVFAHIIAPLKLFAPVMVMIIGLCAIMRRLVDWIKAPVIMHPDDWDGNTDDDPFTPVADASLPIIYKSGIYSKVVTSMTEVMDLAKLAHDIFGWRYISLLARKYLFAMFYKACPSGMRLLLEDGQQFGYCLCLAVHPLIGEAHMRGAFSQFDFIGEELRSKSNIIYIQAVYIAKSTAPRFLALLHTLMFTVQTLIEDPDREITIYFEEYNSASSRIAKSFGFKPIGEESCEGHSIWVLKLEDWAHFKTPSQRLLDRLLRSEDKQAERTSPERDEPLAA